MEINLDISFRNDFQRDLYYTTIRNSCGSGGFGNGKTYAACEKAATLLLTFSQYRYIIARQLLANLKRTTMQTMFKVLPKEAILTHNEQDGKTTLVNGSLIYWMHLDKVDEQSLRGVEPNSILVDQAEETEEGIYTVLDARVGRWDRAVVPQKFLQADPNWPRDEFGRPRVPNYMQILCNPDFEFHWIYRYYHPDSDELRPEHIMFEAPTDERLNDPKTYQQMLARDPEWVAKYVTGKWGASSAAIHFLRKECLLDYTPELIETIKRRGNLFRVLDHGESAPTCCLWVAALDGAYIFFREYYLANSTISNHRRNISDLSENEKYSGSYADPSIFKKESKPNGGYWCLADEYTTGALKAPKLSWSPADNNEFATRNRINEFLAPSPFVKHPITGISPAPSIYFIKQTPDYPFGISHAYRQLAAQRKVLLATVNGKNIYSDEREPSVEDHGYDCVRYIVAMHGNPLAAPRIAPPRNSFGHFNRLRKKQFALLYRRN